MGKTVITYGTFDLLHWGHISLLKRARALGDKLIVGLSTDEFNSSKHKRAIHGFNERKYILEAVRYVDLVIPEVTWEQKESDILKYKVDIFVMGSDWKGKFDNLKEYCEVIYLPRTEGVSTTELKTILQTTKECEYGND